MTHGPTYYPSKGACIYCGATDAPLKDEHIVPYSLGGQHVLRDASCGLCEDITKKFEERVARDLWGQARTSFNAPSRRKKQRSTHIETNDTELERSHLIPAGEFPGAFVFYKMGPCGLLRSLPPTEDISGSWELVVIDDEARRNRFFERHGYNPTHKFRHVPDAFGRMLSKIAYCQVLTALDLGDFNPLVLPYITGEKQNFSYLIGSRDGVPEPNSGYRLSTCYSVGYDDQMLLMAELRLYANTHAPTYDVIVGEVIGREEVARIREKLDLAQ